MIKERKFECDYIYFLYYNYIFNILGIKNEFM